MWKESAIGTRSDTSDWNERMEEDVAASGASSRDGTTRSRQGVRQKAPRMIWVDVGRGIAILMIVTGQTVSWFVQKTR